MNEKFELPHKPVKKRIAELKAAESEVIRAEALPVEHGIKHEMYALSTFLIERYHARAMQILKEQPELSLADLQGNPLFEDAVRDALVVENGQLSFDSEKIRELPEEEYVVDVWIDERVFPSIYRRAFDRALVAERETFDDGTKAVYDRLQNLFYKTMVRVVGSGRNVAQARPQSVEGFIKSGVATAAAESWSILLALHKKYYEEFGRPLTGEDLNLVSGDVKQILNQTASLHIADFEHLRDITAEKGRLDQREIAWDKIIRFSGDFPNTRLVLREEYKKLPEEERERRECTQGCPGRDAIVENEQGRKMNVIGDAFDFHRELFVRIVLPYQDILVRHYQENKY